MLSDRSGMNPPVRCMASACANSGCICFAECTIVPVAAKPSFTVAFSFPTADAMA